MCQKYPIVCSRNFNNCLKAFIYDGVAAEPMTVFIAGTYGFILQVPLKTTLFKVLQRVLSLCLGIAGQTFYTMDLVVILQEILPNLSTGDATFSV